MRSRRGEGAARSVHSSGLCDSRAVTLAELLHDAAETHHVVYRITDGDDPDWASWYADWLLNLSELPALLGSKPVRSHLVHALVQLDRDYTAAQPGERWEDWYATRLGALVANDAPGA